MNVFQSCLVEKLNEVNLSLCQSVCYALWSCSQGIQQENVTIISSLLPLIAGLVSSQRDVLVIPLLGIIEGYASMVSK